MEIITSTANEKIKLIRKLSQKKFRVELGLYVVEGVNILKDMPTTVLVDSFFVTEAMVEKTSDIYLKFSCSVNVVTDAVMKSISDTVSPSGLLAVIEIPKNLPREGNALVLDRVSDSGNVGTLIRTAVSAGFLNIYLINSADVYCSKVARASMGGIFRANLIEVCEEEALNILANYHSVAMDMSGINIFDFTPKAPLAIVLGSESLGVSKRLMQTAENTVSLKMQNDMESLNVAVAGGIAMYELSKHF
ncbi:MAG: RNA methyltransferase [Clostridia bacterium]